MLDSRRVLADEHPRALLDHVFRSALADARYPRIGLDDHDPVALVEAGLARGGW